MVWVEICKRKVKGRLRKGGKRAPRTRFFPRICWPGADRGNKTDGQTFTRRADAASHGRALVEAVEKHDNGLGPDPFLKRAAQNFDTLHEGYVASLTAGGLGHKRRQGKPSAKHVKGSGGKLQLIATALQLRTLADFARLVPKVNERLEELQRMRGWNDRTRDDYAQVLRQFGGWLVLAHYWPRNLLDAVRFVATDASRSFERRALSIDEAERLIMAAPVRPVAEYRRKHPQAKPEVLAKLAEQGRTRGLYYLLAVECGWRRKEMAGTTWADLKLDDGKPAIRVRANVAKAKKERWLSLPSFVAERLREHRERLRKFGPVALTDRVLPVPRHLVENMRKDAAYAGLGEIERTNKKTSGGNYTRGVKWIDPAGPHVRLDVHSLRTTFGTKVVQAVDPTVGHALLRHESVTTTMKHYAKLRNEHLEAELAKVPRLFACGSACVSADGPGAPSVRSGEDEGNKGSLQAHG